jgi:EAL domain-containing protein (putative c-di-GMP-specific phosphodiesterase class I)
VVWVEALIRWRHPDLGLVSPGVFLPVISNSELEITIGNWVIQQAWQQLVAWHQQGLRLDVSVNISSFHLLWPGFLEYVQQVLASNSAVNSNCLHLEILESTALHDLNAVNHVVKTCQDELGLGIALDDFGTGYSSLSHLRHLSADMVKIDQTFVRDMLDDPDDYAIIESVIGLSTAFHREVVAEGVESKEQGIVLLLLGCHLVQGYAVARPMEAKVIAEWVKGYEPYAEWQYYATVDLTPMEATQAIRRIDIAQWLRAFKTAALAAAEPRHWPVIGQRKTHLGRWIKQVRFNRQFGDAWLTEIENRNRTLHELAKVLKTAIESGGPVAINSELEKLELLCQQLDGLFNPSYQLR